MIDTVSYTRNSVAEKVLLAMLDKTKMELKFSGESKTISTNEQSEESDDEEDDKIEESEENG
jgi:hypothetical protein